MPHSIFFTSRGHAVHGSNHPGLGTPVSHGCVRLSLTNASTLYQLVGARGMGETTVIVKGLILPAFLPRASRRNRGQGSFSSGAVRRLALATGGRVICHDCTNISGYSWVRRRDRMGVPVMPVRQFTAAVAIASLLIACALAATRLSPPNARPKLSPSLGTNRHLQGRGGAHHARLTHGAVEGAPLRVVFTAEKPLEGELSLIAPNGHVAATSRDRHGGPPYFWFAEVAAPAAGQRGARYSCARRASASARR